MIKTSLAAALTSGRHVVPLVRVLMPFAAFAPGVSTLVDPQHDLLGSTLLEA